MGYNSNYTGEEVDNAIGKAMTSAQQFYIQKTLNKEGWFRIGLLTAIMSTSSARIVVGGTNADVAPIIMDFQHNFRGNMLSQMPTVMTPLYVTKVRAVKKTSDDVYVDLYFTNIASSLTTVSVFPLEGKWESMNFVDVTSSAGGTVATQIDIVKDGFLDDKVTEEELEDAINGKQDRLSIVNHGIDDTIYTLTPNTLHVWGEVQNLNLTISNENSELNEYMFQFTSGETATTLSLPSNIKWVTQPIIEVGKTYQCSILNGIGVIVSVNNE